MNLAPAEAPPRSGTASIGRTAPSDPTPSEHALLRLQQSRARMQRALSASAPSEPSANSRQPSPALADLLTKLRSIPAAKVLLDAVGSWWSQQPAGVLLRVGSTAASTLMKPLVERHPVALILGALAFGGLLAWSWPWRWLMRPAAISGWLPRFAAGVAAQIPLSVWLSLLQTAQTSSSADVTPPAASTPAL